MVRCPSWVWSACKYLRSFVIQASTRYQTYFQEKLKVFGLDLKGTNQDRVGQGNHVILVWESENREYALHGKSCRIHAELLHVTSQILPI